MSRLLARLREGPAAKGKAREPKRHLKVVQEPAKPHPFKLPVVRGKAPSISLRSIIDSYLAAIYEGDKELDRDIVVRLGAPRHGGVFHASDVSKATVCLRKLALGLYDAPHGIEPRTAQSIRILQNGHFTHARLEHTIIDAVRAIGGDATNEWKMHPDAKLRSGTADLMVVIDGWPYVVEIKSIKGTGDYGFEKLGAYPQADHRGQVNQYMGLSGVHAGWILYECKNTQQLKEYFVRFDEEAFRLVERDRVDVVLRHVRAGTLPDKITEVDGCGGKDRCKYYSVCKARGIEPWAPSGPLEV